GCVEADVFTHGMLMFDGEPDRLMRYGVSDDVAGAVGLTCGGTIEVFIQKIEDTAILREFAQLRAVGERVALATVVDGPQEVLGAQWVVTPTSAQGGSGLRLLDHHVPADTRSLLAAGRTTEIDFGPDGARQGVGIRVLVEVVAPPPQMV